MTEPLWRRYLRLVRPDAARDVDDELDFHLAMREAEYRAQGLAPAAARRQAQERFGRVQDARDACLTVDRRRLASVRRSQLLDALAGDLRYAARGLVRHAAFSATVIATLALGIGATTAIFSAVDAALLRPLPFAEPSRLVTLPGINLPFAPNGVPEEPEPLPNYPDVAAMKDLFTDVAAYAPGGLNLSGDGEALRVNVALVTPSFFQTLGVMPASGRPFTVDEGRPGEGQVAVLSHGLWLRRFGGVPVLGRSVTLNERSYRIVGVMPRGFTFPREADLWLPLSVPTTFATFEAFRSWIPSTTLARLAPGVPAQAAAARLADKWRAVPDRFRETALQYADHPLEPLQGALVGDRQKPLLILLLTTGLLLLIACVNVTSLMLARAATRRREIAMRVVLGASRARVMGQLLVESLVLSLAGSAAGVVVALASLRTVSALLPAAMSSVAAPQVDLRVLGFAVLLAMLTGLGFGLLPALGASRADPGETIKSGGSGPTIGAGRLRRLLVTAELAVALTLLAGAGLMLRSFRELLRTDRGYQAANVGTLELTFGKVTDAAMRGRRRAVVNAVLERLAAMPGVDAAGVVNDLPLRGTNGLLVSVQPEGREADTNNDRYARYLMASSGYFHALGIALLRGRLMNATDTDSAPHVVVVGATMARRLWPGEDAVGKRLYDFGGGRPGLAPSFRTVVGVVADVRETRLDAEPEMQMYFPVSEMSPDNVAIVARASVPAATLLGYLRSAVRESSPAQPVYNVRTMEAVVSASLAPRRTNTVLISAFGGLALLLSIIGVYGVVAYSVTRRSRELGIRSALGATSGRLVALVAREGAGVALAGIALGLVGAWAFTRAMASMLYGVTPTDRLTFVAAPLLLFAMVMVATLVPARRAATQNPLDAIRQD